MLPWGLLSFALVVAACGPTPQGQGDDDDDDDGAASCTPAAVEACYDGRAGTEGVGTCHGGNRTCQADGTWGACVGEVTPGLDACGDGMDQDCDGTVDNALDQDGDGFTNCDGDCCDAQGEGCAEPAKVGPGAIEVDGNELDDDCDGQVDNAAEVMCDTGLASSSGNAMDYARALDLCQTTTEQAHTWGVISARFTLADGTGAPNPAQRSIRPDFGATAVQRGASLVVLSTANAAATGHTNPAPSNWQSTQFLTGSNYPMDWYQQNGNHLPNAPGCPAPIDPPFPLPGLFKANDPILLELRVRTPANAQSFSLRTNFMSAEFPEYVCTQFNDFFVVLLDSGWNGQPANPPDKNLAFYVNAQNMRYPVGVNLAHGNTGLFQNCQNGATGCRGTVPGAINTCVGNAGLVGTGMELAEPGASPCQASPRDQVGGGTGWLTTTGNVRGGEVITLRIAVWDTSDGQFDSVALADAFEWALVPSQPGTVIGLVPSAGGAPPRAPPPAPAGPGPGGPARSLTAANRPVVLGGDLVVWACRALGTELDHARAAPRRMRDLRLTGGTPPSFGTRGIIAVVAVHRHGGSLHRDGGWRAWRPPCAPP